MTKTELIDWLLEGDVSIRYQVYRDLLDEERSELQARIATEGWGARFLSVRKPDGNWGFDFYQPKWISSHYTILDLRNLCILPNQPKIKESIEKIITERKNDLDGGINPARSVRGSDVCVNGMFLNYASYFRAEESKLESVVDFLLSQHMQDGGFNCRTTRSGAVHSSVHSTLSVLEGFIEFEKNGYQYRLKEIKAARLASEEFLLMHQLFRSDRTGEIIHKGFLKFPFSRRWKYDILSALDYFRYARSDWDDRLQPAIDVLLEKQNKNNTWNTQAKHSGQIHFEPEKAGKPGRWNTLRALRILRWGK